MSILPVIPLPRAYDVRDAHVSLPATYAVGVYADALDTLAVFARRTHGIDMVASEPASIVFSTDSSLPAEGYALTITAEGVAVRAADGKGAQHAAVTLVQLMQKDGNGLSLPVGTVEDAPECSWRAVMIDLARNWHAFPMLFEYVDLCCFYKIKSLHLHFTDDQSYTLPSRLFPDLSTEGRSYTFEEIRELNEYAARRGVELIPEIDVPGHTASFSGSYGEIFGADGIICLSDESMEAMRSLFRELCEMFPQSPYIHTGGDEASIMKWTECDKCLAAFRARGVDVDGTDKKALSQIMYATFVKEMCEVVLSCGKTPVVWEGFAAEVNHMIPREAVISSWENYYQTTPSLRDAGFRLINCSWNPMYIVYPAVYWSQEDVYKWDVYSWMPMHGGSPYIKTGLKIEPTEQVEGGQLLAWGDHIAGAFPDDIATGVREEQAVVEGRAPALAENTWNRVKRTDWDEFRGRLAAVEALYAAFRNQ